MKQPLFLVNFKGRRERVREKETERKREKSLVSFYCLFHFVVIIQAFPFIRSAMEHNSSVNKSEKIMPYPLII